MNKAKPIYVGIDVSKDTFNFHCGKTDGKCKNCRQGWQELAKKAPPNSVFAMEATGVYHIRLASFLHSKGFRVMVFNPLRVRHYMLSLGSKAKTDKKDARLISVYAGTKEAKVCEWKPLPPKLARARAMVSLLSALAKFENASGNINHAVDRMIGGGDKSLLGVMANVSDVCKEQKEYLRNELRKIVSEVYPEKFRLLQTIHGIGSYTAAVLLVCARGLEFGTSRQLVSFVGLAPSVKESGVSVRGKGRIVKTGNSYLRSLLYMCSFIAVKRNEACNGLYGRLVANGKRKPVAYTAVMHRLVKIAWGVVQSGEPCRIGRVSAV